MNPVYFIKTEVPERCMSGFNGGRRRDTPIDPDGPTIDPLPAPAPRVWPSDRYKQSQAALEALTETEAAAWVGHPDWRPLRSDLRPPRDAETALTPEREEACKTMGVSAALALCLFAVAGLCGPGLARFVAGWVGMSCLALAGWLAVRGGRGGGDE